MKRGTTVSLDNSETVEYWEVQLAMDILSFIRKKLKLFIVLAIMLFIILPYAIDKIVSQPAFSGMLSVNYTSTDILSFYGTILGSAATIVALIGTVQHSRELYSLDYERKLTPLLDSNIFVGTSTGKNLSRIRYVNVCPNRIWDTIQVFESLDPRDLEDTFFFTQMNYLIQNISETSAVNIKISINGNLLCNPFSLIADCETSIGIRFFELRDSFMGEYSFDVDIQYTNSDKSKLYRQTEKIEIVGTMYFGENPSYFALVNGERTGLSGQEIIK